MVQKTDGKQNSGIQIFDRNPFYWQYKGKPVLLLGGSVEDNLFQIDNLKQHLELLHVVGGNYIRCTMSSRDEGDVKPYLRGDDDLFDLDEFNPVYWQKLEDLLITCQTLDIIVQIEVWATYDFYWGEAGWAQNPFNPRVNKTYSSTESKLPEEISHPAQSKINPFFLSVPKLHNNEFLLAYQKSFVDKLLSISLSYENVLYCIDNETLAPYPWGKYWSNYLRTVARRQGNQIFVTEMWDYWDPSGGEVAGTVAQSPALGDWFADYTNPELHENANFSYTFNDLESYQFLDVSNHNAQKGEIHAQTASWVREAVKKSGNIRPINNVKIYGGDMDNIWAGNRRDGKERFCRNIFAGHASVRFHRPIFGMGLDEEAQAFIKSMRLLTDSVDFFAFSPANQLLGDRQENQAYCMANHQGEFLIYFPANGEVSLKADAGAYELRSLHMSTSTWSDSERIELPGVIKSQTDDHWCMVVRRLDVI